MEAGESIRGARWDSGQDGLRVGWGRRQLTGGLEVRRFRLQRLSQSARSENKGLQVITGTLTSPVYKPSPITSR